MDATLVNDEIEAVMRTIRLAQAQVATLKKICAGDTSRLEELESVEVVLDMVMRKLEALKIAG
jgi:hypothetical protein